MKGLFQLYCLPGKLIAELWYLWPKKGQVFASARRRDHGFVHFLYSTMLYLVTVFILLAGSAGGKRAEAVDVYTDPVTDADQSDAPAQVYEPYPEPTPLPAELAGTEATYPEDAPAEEEAPAIVFESHPVVQDIPGSEQIETHDGLGPQ